MICRNCSSSSLSKRGIRHGNQTYQCNECGKYTTENVQAKSGRSSFQASKDIAEVSTTTDKRIRTLEELVEVCEIDLNEWEVERWICNKWEVGAVDKYKQLKVEPLFQVKAWLRRKTQEIRTKLVVDDILKDIKQLSIEFPKIKYPEHENGMTYEIDIPDVHFGRLSWDKETGEDYDIKIAKNAVHKVVDELLSYSKYFPISKILLPIGNDWFNVNDKNEVTAHGTPQQEDTRWQKTFTMGRKLAQEVIDKCSSVAPVDVLIITGNHDEERTFYMGDALSCRYEGSQDVSIDNSPKTRKYRLYGKNLIGFAHGYNEKLVKLPAIMALEEPVLWSKAKTREFHTGDKHHLFTTTEDLGVTVRILRALTAVDAWTFNSGYVGAVRAAESFLWDDEKGLIAQFTARP